MEHEVWDGLQRYGAMHFRVSNVRPSTQNYAARFVG